MMIISVYMCLCLQQFKWRIKAAELWDVRAAEAECEGEWSNEARGGRSSQEARDSWPHVATSTLRHKPQIYRTYAFKIIILLQITGS